MLHTVLVRQTSYLLTFFSLAALSSAAPSSFPLPQRPPRRHLALPCLVPEWSKCVPNKKGPAPFMARSCAPVAGHMLGYVLGCPIAVRRYTHFRPPCRLSWLDGCCFLTHAFVHFTAAYFWHSWCTQRQLTARRMQLWSHWMKCPCLGAEQPQDC